MQRALNISFPIIVNYITKELSKNVPVILYADDFAIFVFSNHVKNDTKFKIRKKKQVEMKFSQDEKVIFKFSKIKRGSNPNITFYSKEIRVLESALPWVTLLTVYTL